VCGGSFLYVKALLFGLAAAPPADEALRRRHAQRAEAEGSEALHADLARVDSVSAARLNPNDRVRVSRALEVYELTGIPLSRWQIDHGFGTPRYSARLVGIGWSREQLDHRIRTRAQSMLDAGWVGEVEQLLKAGYGEARAMQSVGYRQIADALAEGRADDSATLLEQIIRATRVFARRQRTWLRDQTVHWVVPDRMAAVRWEHIQATSGSETRTR
jgi:tRNA dimethylallyltransferase